MLTAAGKRERSEGFVGFILVLIKIAKPFLFIIILHSSHRHQRTLSSRYRCSCILFATTHGRRYGTPKRHRFRSHFVAAVSSVSLNRKARFLPPRSKRCVQPLSQTSFCPFWGKLEGKRLLITYLTHPFMLIMLSCNIPQNISINILFLLNLDFKYI